MKNRYNTEDSDENLPAIVKSSIMQKNENTVTFNVNSIIKNIDYFPLETLVVSELLKI